MRLRCRLGLRLPCRVLCTRTLTVVPLLYCSLVICESSGGSESRQSSPLPSTAVLHIIRQLTYHDCECAVYGHYVCAPPSTRHAQPKMYGVGEYSYSIHLVPSLPTSTSELYCTRQSCESYGRDPLTRPTR